MTPETCPLLEEAIKFAKNGKPGMLSFFQKKCNGCDHLVSVRIVQNNVVVGEIGKCAEGVRLVCVNGVLAITSYGLDTGGRIKE